MRYALIVNDLVQNIIWLYPGNTSDFPNAIPCNNIPVSINDIYIDGAFYRNGNQVLSITEEYEKTLKILLGEEE